MKDWIWTRERKAAPARETLSREQIVAAAMTILDTEGIAGLSMRKLGTKLAAGATSLYWYVDTKDDLLELALDTVFGEIPPPRQDADWPDRLRELATSYREMLVRHTWASPLAGSLLNIGPHSMLFSYAIHDVIRATGLPLRHQTGAMSAVFQFVYGFGTTEGHVLQRSIEAGLTQDEFFQQAMSSIRDHPQLKEIVQASQAMMDARGGDTIQEMRERDFTFALDLMIAGIETMCARADDR